MLTSNNVHWPAELLKAQYLNLVDRMVQNHTVRQNKGDTMGHSKAMHHFHLAALEVAETLSDYTYNCPLKTRRVVQASDLIDVLLDIRSSPYDRLAYGDACSRLANLILNP